MMIKKILIIYWIALAIMLFSMIFSSVMAAECNLTVPSVELVKILEGFSEEPYLDESGVLTIGYGWTNGVESNHRLDREDAEKLLVIALGYVNAKVNSYVEPELTDNQCIALHSLVYNIGIDAFHNSTLLKKLNNNDFPGAEAEFGRWIYVNGKKISLGLVERRKIEKMLFRDAKN